MPKLSKAVAEARRIFSSLADEAMSLVHAVNEVASPVERKKFKTELMAEIGLPTTKAGRPTLPKEIRNDPEAIKKVSAKVESITNSPKTGEKILKATLADAAYYMLAVKPRRVRQINRMLRDIREVFGVSSSQAREAYNEVAAMSGVVMTKGGYVSEVKSKTMDPYALEMAYYKTPRAKSIWDKAWEELFEDSPLAKKDKKELRTSHWKSPTLRKSVARYAAVSSASEDDYAEVLKALYETAPEDMTTSSYADYEDMLHELAHPGRQLSYGEIAANIDEITKFLAGSITNI